MDGHRQTDLFDIPPAPQPYPEAPGFKERGGASEAAAKAIKNDASQLRLSVLSEFVRAEPYGLTADQCAERLNRDVLSIRPRCSELVAQGQLMKTPTRRPTVRKQTASVMRVTPIELQRVKQFESAQSVGTASASLQLA